MEHIPARHAARVGMQYTGWVAHDGPDFLIVDLDLTRVAPGRSPFLHAEIHFDRTAGREQARRLKLADAVDVVLIEVDNRPSYEWLLASLPADSAWLTWNDETVRRLARHIRETGESALLPVLADALEDAGCTDTALLDHCREPHEEGSWSWAVELLATQK